MPWWFVAGGIVAIATLWGAWWLWWRLPKRQVESLSLKIRDPKARADVEDNYRKTIGQLIGGIAVRLDRGHVYVFAILAAAGGVSCAAASVHALLISNQLAKGFEQLGSNNVVMRLGGIYALEGVMNTSAQYHDQTLEALCAYVRDVTKNERGDHLPVTIDTQTALTAIGRRRVGAGSVDLAHAHIPYAVLLNADLSGAYLSGADLRSADLRNTDLRNTYLSRADLTAANLTGANLSGADLSGANLTGADLSGADLTRADLIDAVVTQSQFNDACGDKETRLNSLKPCK